MKITSSYQKSNVNTALPKHPDKICAYQTSGDVAEILLYDVVNALLYGFSPVFLGKFPW